MCVIFTYSEKKCRAEIKEQLPSGLVLLHVSADLLPTDFHSSQRTFVLQCEQLWTRNIQIPRKSLWTLTQFDQMSSFKSPELCRLALLDLMCHKGSCLHKVSLLKPS